MDAIFALWRLWSLAPIEPRERSVASLLAQRSESREAKRKRVCSYAEAVLQDRQCTRSLHWKGLGVEGAAGEKGAFTRCSWLAA